MWLHTAVLSHCVTCVLFCVFAACQDVWSQRKAVLLWPQLWAATPPIWESWTWATIIQETQERSYCLLDWRIHTGDWTLSGMDRQCVIEEEELETFSLSELITDLNWIFDFFFFLTEVSCKCWKLNLIRFNQGFRRIGIVDSDWIKVYESPTPH